MRHFRVSAKPARNVTPSEAEGSGSNASTTAGFLTFVRNDMRRTLPRVAYLLSALIIILCAASAAESNSVKDYREIFRIRVENSVGGKVQISVDGGTTLTTVGHVNRCATCTIKGFPAASYTSNRAVAATAVHSIRIKTDTRSGDPMTVSIVSSEFAKIPEGYGGFVPLDSGIYTDIPAGIAIFRNFAPFVGSPLKLERKGRLVDLPGNWQPACGDVLVIVTSMPQPYLSRITFENKTGGAVIATYDDGTTENLGLVTSPVTGVGRFDATSYTGEGMINTNHGGVVTISTAPIANTVLPEGQGSERRGGFQIQPSEHYSTQPPMTQTMAVGPLPGHRSLEGQPPLFSGYIGLAFDPKSPENSARAEVGFADGTWQPLPGVVGKENDFLKRIGVVRVRLLFPRYDPAFLSRSLIACAERPKGPTIRGIAKLAPSASVKQGSMVAFMVDGRVRGITNQPPYDFMWDTTAVPNGEHEVEIDVSDSLGSTISSEKRRMVVWNPG